MNRRSEILRRVFDTFFVAAVSSLGLLTAAYAALAPRNSDAGVAVIYAPWVTFESAFVRSVDAGARFVRSGGVPFVVVVVPDDADYARRVRAGGAWMLADPAVLAACIDTVTGERRS